MTEPRLSSAGRRAFGLLGLVLLLGVVAGLAILLRSERKADDATRDDVAQKQFQAQADSPASEPPPIVPPSETPWDRPDLVAGQAPALTRDTTSVIPSRIATQTVGQNQIDDPTRDGWSTEVWSSRAEKQLKALIALLQEPGKLTIENVAPIVAEDFRCSPLRPSEAQVVYKDSRLQVVRAEMDQLKPAEFTQRGAAAFIASAQELMETLAGAPGARTKIKTYGVSPRPDGLTTRIDFSASHRRGFEHHATWECRWSFASMTAEPRLQEITLLDFEEIHASLADSVLFIECTESVMGANPSYHEQLVPGIYTWLQSIDISVDPDFEGMQGLALGDVNGDGLEDLYLCQGGGLPNRLFVHNADGTVTDVSAEAGVDWIETTRSALLIDLDNDGDQDLVLAPDGLLMIMSNDGAGHFTEEARFPEVTLAFSLAAADYDRDGDLDVYASRHFSEAHKSVGHLPNPVPYHDANNGGRNLLLRNDGGWKFTDVTVESGLDENNQRWSYAAAWEDYDNDGDLDLYVANDFGRNNLYRNDGGSFVDVAAEAGVEDIASGMSVSWGDYNGDGYMDLYVSNMFSSAGSRITYQRNFKSDAPEETKAYYQRLARGNTLFQNLGDGSFRDLSNEADVTMGRWAWASNFVDINNDGKQDLVVANGYVTGEDSGDL